MKKVSKIWIVFSYSIAILSIITSLLGILTSLPYSKEAESWALQAIGQDIGNLIATIVLLFSTYFLSKKSIKTFFIWQGTLLYFIYAYLIYAFFIHFNYLFLVYIIVLGLSFYTVIGSLFEQDLISISKSFLSKHEKSASILLIIIGSLFGFLWLSEIIPALISSTIPASLINTGLWVSPVQVIDLAIVLPAMIITGIFLIKKNFLGRLFSGPWLMFSTLMGSSIVATMIMELINGNNHAIVPLVMIGIITVSSAITLNLYLKK